MSSDALSEDWKKACEAADRRIEADIARHYGLRTLEFIFDFLRPNIPDDLFAKALEVRLLEYDYEDFHRRCQSHLEEQKRAAARDAVRTARLPSSHKWAWDRGSAEDIIGHHRYQLPVGQGGFHVGTLSYLTKDNSTWKKNLVGDAIGSADLMYVYDCGSEPLKGAKDQIASVVARRPSRRLDFLFISHFDRDHICGIPHLLHPKKGLQVDTIVMPYLDEVERIIAFGRVAAAGGDNPPDRFYQDVVADPVGTMSRFGPRQILLVMSSEDDAPEGGVIERSSPPRSGEESAQWRVRRSSEAGDAPETWITSDGATVTKDVEFEIAGGSCGGWLLKPHVKRASRRDQDAFCTALEVALEWPRSSFRDKVKIEKIRRLLVTTYRMAVARAYAYAFGDKNETSMSLYSGPVDPSKAGAVVYGSTFYERSRVGWLGTGDAGFTDPRVVQNFRTHYRNELDWLHTFVLPHHGSKHNFDPSIKVVDAELWVAAAQPTHQNWEHPSKIIVDAVKSSGGKMKVVSASPDTLLVEKMVVFLPG